MRTSTDPDSAHRVIAVGGELDLAAAASLRASIDRARQGRDDAELIIDLEAVTFLDSAGLCELMRPLADGCAVTLRHPSEAVRRVLHLAGVADSFTSIDT